MKQLNKYHMTVSHELLIKVQVLKLLFVDLVTATCFQNSVLTSM